MVSLRIFKAFLNGVGVLGDSCNKFRLILGVRWSTSLLLFVSVTVGVFKVVPTIEVQVFWVVGVEVLLLAPGELRNCDGENGSDFIGVQVFGLLKILSDLSCGITVEILAQDSFSSVT